MLPVTDKMIRASFVNASRKEVSDLNLPPNFAALDFDALDFVGWRDPVFARRAYVVVPTDAEAGAAPGLTGVLLKQAEASPRAQVQCTWCQDVTLPNPVVFYSAKRAGAAGRNGDTIGTLVCADFQCSTNARKAPPVAYLGFDIEAAREQQIAALRLRSAGFARTVVDGR